MIELKKLVANIDEYLEDRGNAVGLEQSTLTIISDDQFDDLDPKIQDAIHA
jgi:hypothetical protein